MGFAYQHKMDGWDKLTKSPNFGENGCYIHVGFTSLDEASATGRHVRRLWLENVQAVYHIFDKTRPPSAFRQAVDGVIQEELQNLRDGSPEGAWGKRTKVSRRDLPEWNGLGGVLTLRIRLCA